MARFYPVSVELEGRKYSGEWELRLGGEIYVRSPAYGRLSAPVGRRKPELVAVDILAQIVKAWRRKQAREAREIARETERVAKGGRPRNATSKRT